MRAGRPYGTLKYDNIDDLHAGIEAYFADCEKRNAPYTLSGLAYALNIDVSTLRNYGHMELFSDEITRARARCRQYAHEAAYDRDKCRGATFDLSANYGMSERQQLDLGNADGEPFKIDSVADADKIIEDYLKKPGK